MPANTRAAGLLIANPPDGGSVAYAATTHGCGSQPDGVWAMELGADKKDVVAFQPRARRLPAAAGRHSGATARLHHHGGRVVADVEPADRARIEDAQAEGLGDRERRRTSARRRSSSRIKTRRSSPSRAAGKLYLFDSTALAGGPIATAAATGTEKFEPARWRVGTMRKTRAGLRSRRRAGS